MSALTRYPPFNTQIYNSLLQSYVLFYKLYKVFFSQSKYIVYIEQSLVEKKKNQLAIYWHNVKQQDFSLLRYLYKSQRVFYFLKIS